MHKVTRYISMLFAFTLMLAVGVSLGAPAPGANNSTTKTTTKAVTRTKPAASKNAVTSMAKASTKKNNRVLASAEDLSGTITVIGPADREITVVGANGVPYDFQLTKKTRVELANKKVGMNELASESHKQATIHFVPRSDGNRAESIQINPS